MEIDLPPRFERMLREEQEAGGYPDAAHVVMAALVQLRDREEEVSAWMERNKEPLREMLQHGIDQLDRGEVAEFDAEDIKREGRKRLAARRAQRSAH